MRHFRDNFAVLCYSIFDQLHRVTKRLGKVCFNEWHPCTKTRYTLENDATVVHHPGWKMQGISGNET